MSGVDVTHLLDATDTVVSFTTGQAVRLRILFESMGNLLCEDVMSWKKDGIYTLGHRKDVTADVFLSGTLDDVHYIYAHNESELNIGVSFGSMHDALTAAAPVDTVSIYATKKSLASRRPYIYVKVFNREVGYDYLRKVNLIMLKKNNRAKRMPPAEQVISMSSSLFQKVLRNGIRSGEICQIYTHTYDNKRSFLIVRVFSDNGPLIFRQKFQTTEPPVYKEETFSLQFLNQISKVTNLSPTAEIFLRRGAEFGIKYRVGTIGYITYTLQPGEKREQSFDFGDVPNDKKGVNVAVPKVTQYKRPIRRKKRVRSMTIDDSKNVEPEPPIKKQVKKNNTTKNEVKKRDMSIRDFMNLKSFPHLRNT